MYSRGDVVVAPDPFGDTAGRPYLVLSDENHPFFEEEAICAAITRTERSEAVPITSEAFVSGGLPIDPSYVSPWVLVTIKHDDVLDRSGRLDGATIDRVGSNVSSYVDP